MNLQERHLEAIENEFGKDSYKSNNKASVKCEQITIEFAKEFAEWKEEGYTKRFMSDDDYNGLWFDEYQTGINRHYYTTDQLIQLFINKKNLK